MTNPAEAGEPTNRLARLIEYVGPEPTSSSFGPSTSSDERKRQVIHAAALLFEQRGFHGTSMQNIADAVGITKASLYHYVSNKQDLLFEIHDAYIDTTLAQVRKYVAEGHTPEERVRFFIYQILWLIANYRPYVRAFFQEFNMLDEKYLSKMRVKRDEYVAIVEQAFLEGEALGTFDLQGSARAAMLYFFGSCNWAYQWLDISRSDRADIETLTDQWYRLTIDGMRRRQGGIDSPG